MARLFISFYLFIAVSLIGLAALLNSVFFDDGNEHAADQQALVNVLALVNQHNSETLRISAQRLQWPNTVMALSELALPATQNAELQARKYLLVHDDSDQRFIYFLLDDKQLMRLQLPDDKSESSLWLYSGVFFLVLGALIAIWLWPLWRDLNVLKNAATSLQDDGSLASAQLPSSSIVAPIAIAFNRLGQQVKGLLQTQRELTGAVAHELRTPLSRMKFALANQPTPTRWQELQHDVDELERLVQEMLDYASLESTLPDLNFGEIPLHELLKDLQKRVLIPADKTLLIEDTTLTLNGDSHFIERALQNIITNALRHARSRVQVSVSEQDEELLICCDDDGSGVAESERERIFDAFYRPDGGRDRRRGGAGLGLAIVKRIQHWHDGHCWVESSPLGGARFVLSFRKIAQ